MSAPSGGLNPQFNGLSTDILTSESSKQHLCRTSSMSNSNFDGAMSSRPTPATGNPHADAQLNLLGLLKFAPTQTPQSTPQQVQAAEPARPAHNERESYGSHRRGISASDLVASLKSGGSKPSTPAQPVPRSSSASHQASLLKLLNQTTSAAEEAKAPPTTAKGQTSPRVSPPPSRNSPPVRVFGSKETTPTPFQPETINKPTQPKRNVPVFTYVNPFEQLSASSPLNPQAHNKPSDDAATKRDVNTPSPANACASSRPTLTDSGNEILQSVETPQPVTKKDGRTQEEALMGIGAPSKDAETVAEALNEVGNQVHKQMEHALEEAESQQPDARRAKVKPSSENGAVDPRNTVEDQAIDASETEELKDLGILTYQIPMRPFVLIEIRKDEAGVPLREESIVSIARFKKDFDQIDRTLATASKEFIVYGVTKNGGIRVIQQENGVSNLLFPNIQDRIFNVAISTAGAQQCVIGTGTGGNVYWTTVKNSSGELDEADIEAHTLVIPPSASGTDPTSNGKLKTRAKRSNRHPEFFAIGRGRYIQILFPMHARESKQFGNNLTLDTDEYFSERSLKVTTGKTGKDFAFSEDDTMIATLDKAGRLRLWDIRELIHPDNATASTLAPIEVKTPILTFSLASPAEKTWPTSVLFVDKARSYQKGIAQRYVIVGMKQNHTLQLWDLCLGKAVQEMSFPHGKESDPICSIAFHPDSSYIVVGHPTRNSIYIIQLSAPRYHLPGLSQAKLAHRLANKDSTLPRTEATAIMSNFREYSLSSIGQLRSLDLAPPGGEAHQSSEGQENLPIFDLYVMHSKGVTCLGFKKEDLGSSTAGKILHPIDAEDSGHVLIKDLRDTPTPSTTDPASTNGDARPVTPSRASARAMNKEVEKHDRKNAASTTIISGDKVEKKRSKEDMVEESIPKTSVDSSQAIILTPREFSPMPQQIANEAKLDPRRSAQKALSGETLDSAAPASNEVKSLSDGEPISLGISTSLLDKEMKKIERGVSSEFNKSLQHQLDALHRRLDSDQQVRNATVAANQEAILRLVSKQLGHNVEKSLASIVLKSIKESVTPSVSDVATTVIEKHLPHVVGQQIEHLLPLHLKSILPDAVSRTMQTKDLYRAVSDQVTKGVTGHVEKEIMGALQTSIIPQFQNMAISATQKIGPDTVDRIWGQLQQAEVQRREDSAKIDQLSNSVRVLSETIHQMATAQSDFQSEILRLQQKSLQGSRALIRQGSPTPSESASMHVNPEQHEIQNVSAMMQQGNYEQATITWLQSGQQVALFDQVFARYHPGYLRQISPLVALSVGAAVTTSFDANLQQRLAWTETVLSRIDPNHSEIRQVVRKVMDFVGQRLANAYMHIAEEQPSHTSLRQIATLTRRSQELMNLSPMPTE